MPLNHRLDVGTHVINLDVHFNCIASQTVPQHTGQTLGNNGLPVEGN